MNKTFIIIILILLPFSSLATFDKKCNLKNISYISPSLGGCIFQITPSGQIIYIMNNNKVSDDKCLSSFLKGKEIDDFKNKITDMKKDLSNNSQKTPILHILEENGGYSGKLSNEKLGIGSFNIPFMKKDFGGNAKIFLDNGLNIYLKIKENAELSIIGGFGKVTMTGLCKQIND